MSTFKYIFVFSLGFLFVDFIVSTPASIFWGAIPPAIIILPIQILGGFGAIWLYKGIHKSTDSQEPL